MEYNQTVTLKDGRQCILRSGTARDAQAYLSCFRLAHAQTDFLRTYPDECTLTVEQEENELKEKRKSASEAEILAEVDGRVVGSAGIERVGDREKVRKRAVFGISIEKAYWGLGIGRALTEACIACARKARYAQLELEAVAQNERAVALYKKLGFAEFGRNPKGMLSRTDGWQEVVLMRLDLEDP
ncbi:MAG: N-acetyltransferase [Clostridia bacterium]|nr:N-acetyltransferase [Clostridia bacterium]